MRSVGDVVIRNSVVCGMLVSLRLGFETHASGCFNASMVSYNGIIHTDMGLFIIYVLDGVVAKDTTNRCSFIRWANAYYGMDAVSNALVIRELC